jgi:predicted DNA-binding protein
MGGASDHRYLHTIDAELAKALARAARRAKKTPAALLRELILERLQEQDDYRAVLASRKKRGRTYSHPAVKRLLGLEG